MNTTYKRLIHMGSLCLCVLFGNLSYAQMGCTYSNASNYDPAAVTDDGSCMTYDCYPQAYSIDFERMNWAIGALAENQDVIFEDLTIARNAQEGLFNGATQTNFDGLGPEGTLWKLGTWEAGDIPTETYVDWRQHSNYNPPSLVGNTSTLYLIDYDLYFHIEWSSWQCCQGGGGFAYTRTLINDATECSEVAGTYGCTNEIADNYDPQAIFDEGCIIPGCTDPVACNYDPVATEDDGSCTDTCPGCMVEGAANYDPTANVDDGSCTIWDCFDPPYIVQFEKENYAPTNLEENQDRIADDVWITRGTQQGIFNIFVEPVFDFNGPTGTLWKAGIYDEGDNPFTDYSSWYNHHNGNAITLPGTTSVIFLEDHNAFFQIDWEFWQSNAQGGGFAYTRTFIPTTGCSEIAAILGCTDEEADNYDIESNLDDGTCIYLGCTDPTACNFDEMANEDDGSCTDECPGCTFPQASNYDPSANVDDGSCMVWDCLEGSANVTFLKEDFAFAFEEENQDIINDNVRITRGNQEGLFNYAQETQYNGNGPSGTLWKLGEYDETDDPLADYQTWVAHSNYNPPSLVGQTSTLYLIDEDQYFSITWTDWTCCGAGGGFGYTRTFIPTGDCMEIAAIYGCTDEMADNYNAQANLEDDTCIYPGCTDPMACNYDEMANEDDGSCTDECPGCTIPEASNYDPAANIDDGSCLIWDCFEGNPNVTFVKEDYAIPYVEGNSDVITDLVQIARNNQQGLYNIAQETNYNGNGPSGTLWKLGSYDETDDPLVDYEQWVVHADYDPENLVGQTSVLYLVDEDLYFNILWTDWTCCAQGGGFGYIRTFIGTGDCLEIPGTYGCTNPIADNYSEVANLDDGTCIIMGCTDPEACNYDEIATVDDGSCLTECFGCTWEGAANYDPIANVDDGSCEAFDCFSGSGVTTFQKANNADWTLAENQDQILPDVWITRQNEAGIYNAFTDNSYNDQFWGGPQNTLWKVGIWQEGDDPTNDYQTWVDHHDYNAENLPGSTSVMYLVDYDFYFEIEWLSWTCCGNGGGFAYTRTFIQEASAECATIPAIYGCNNENAANYDPEAQANDGSCIILGCTDDTACNFDPEANTDDESCYYDDGNIALECAEDINIVMYGDNLTETVFYETPILLGTCDEIQVNLPISDAILNLVENSEQMLDDLGNTFNFAYDGFNEINDGGGDMYDGGNQLSTSNGSNVSYTDGDIESNLAFGQNSLYATLELPGLFVALAEDMDISEFNINGNNGADGSGTITTYEFNALGGLYNAHYKGICNAGDPSINHLIIHPNANAAYSFSGDTNDDFHQATGLDELDHMYYVLWAGNNGFCYSLEEITSFLDAFLAQVTNGDLILESGLPSGSDFPIGTTENVWSYEYEGDTYSCSSSVTIDLAGCMDETACNYNENATIDSGVCTFEEDEVGLVCPPAIEIVAAPYEEGAEAWFQAALVTGDCDAILEDGINYGQVEGLESGSYFPLGQTINTWAYEDEFGTGYSCSSSVTVYPYFGCTDENADNYTFGAVEDDGSCLLLDCEGYDGPISKTFLKANFADWTEVENQDQITDNTWITRQNNQGIYNEFDQDGWPGNEIGGPSNTEWYLGTTDEGLAYTTWILAADNNPNVNCNNDSEMALRLIDVDIHFDIVWHSFTSGNNGGGLNYTRTINVDLSGCETSELIYGCIDQDACNFDPEANLADDSCVFPGDECDDGDELTFDDVYQEDCSCSGVVSVEDLQLNTISTFNVMVRDAKGSIVKTTQITGKPANIQFLLGNTGLSTGMYIVEMYNVDFTINKKIFIQR